jgi:hypothetical protein
MPILGSFDRNNSSSDGGALLKSTMNDGYGTESAKRA